MMLLPVMLSILSSVSLSDLATVQLTGDNVCQTEVSQIITCFSDNNHVHWSGAGD